MNRSLEFLPYPDWSIPPSVVADALRGMSFADACYLYEGYSYRKIAGGALRRKMFGTHFKEAFIAELNIKKTDLKMNRLNSKQSLRRQDC